MRFSVLRRLTWASLFVLALVASFTGIPAQKNLQKLPAADFSRLVREFSEADGFFRSDNFTSNETSYLHVVDKLRELGVSAGAYIGVGPEQNFTYIAKVRPRIAFIIDIRRQAVIQHLLYKAVFHTSKSRAEFLSGLLSRPLGEEGVAGKESSIERLVQYFRSVPASEPAFAANLSRVRKIIQEEFQFPLSDQDQQRLEYVYAAFHKEGLGIVYRAGPTNWSGGSGFPSLGDLIVQPDAKGTLGNFLATEEDYQFVRNLQLNDRIIPVVGDFAGPKAFASVGEYLRKNDYVVSAFYTSNVEQYLFQNEVFAAFAENVRKLPINADSVFIRAVAARGQIHPANVAGHRSTTLLQKISVFLKDHDAGAYTDYRSLVTTN